MLIVGSILLLLAVAVTLRREKSILFNRVAVLILLYSGILGFDSLYVESIGTGIGVFSGLFHSTSITHIFYIFIYIIGGIILQLRLFNPICPVRKISILTVLTERAFEKSGYYNHSKHTYGNSELATTAGLTYFLLGGLSSGFILLGSSLLYINSGLTSVIFSLLTSLVSFPLSFLDTLSVSLCTIPALVGSAPGTFISGKLVLSPYFLTGIADAESCFSINFYKNKKYKTGWQVRSFFQIQLHKKDRALLEGIRTHLSEVGQIYEKTETLNYIVYSNKDLKVIIDHFDRYPLSTQKQADYILFKQVLDMKDRQEHLSEQGLCKVVAIKGSMNWGLSETLKSDFPNSIPVQRPSVQLSESLDPYWLAGFVSGEACFSIYIQDSSSHSLGKKISLKFQIAQHTRDVLLMKSLVTHLGCGRYEARSKGSVGYFVVTRFSDISGKIIPFFIKYPLLGAKALDFADFCEAAKIIEEGRHLTAAGLEEICKLKAGMNRGRSSS